jgi:phosphoglycolate phosphatase-like HAD superfamily hydrolase
VLYLFDIDGTLIGGDGSGRRAFDRACLDCLGITGALDHLRLDGMTDPLILDGVFRHHHGRAPSADEAQQILETYVRHLEAEVAAGKYHVKPAVHDTLDHLERRGDATIGLATGNVERGARIKLTRGDLWRRFAFGGFGSDAPATTDGRATLVRVAIERGTARAGRSFGRDEIFVIGDTPKDIAAAHAAGARAVAVATGWYSLDDLRAAAADAAYPTMAEWLATL